MQLTYSQEIQEAAAGLRLGLVEGERINSFSNKALGRKVYSATIDAADVATGVSFLLHNGVAGSVSVNDADDTKTKDELASDLAVAINESSAASGLLLATAAGDVVTVSYKALGSDFTLTAVANTTVAVEEALVPGIEVPFGSGVVYAAEEGLCALPSANSESFAGVALIDKRLAMMPDVEGLPAPRKSYLPDDTVAVLESGRVWVLLGEDVKQGDPAYAGADGFYKSADAARVDTKGEFLKGGSQGELGLLQL